MSELIWHDIECGQYTADLPLWRALADASGGPILDVGAGSGRVTLDLLGAGHELIALDNDPELLAGLEQRVPPDDRSRLTVVCEDARAFALARRDLALVIVPMQTVQLLGGADGRAALLDAVRAHLRPCGRLALALADALEGYDVEEPMPPDPDVGEVDGVRYVSQAIAVRDDGDAVAIDRVRTVLAPDAPRSELYTVRLDALDADTLEDEGVAAGFAIGTRRTVAATDEHVGSTVVVLGA